MATGRLRLAGDVTKVSNGAVLADGDSVTLIKDLKVKRSGGVTLKRGTLVRNIRLTGGPDEIEAMSKRSGDSSCEPGS